MNLTGMSKKLLVLSDTHGNTSALTAVLKHAKTLAPDAAVFLGDGLQDLQRAQAATGFSCEWHCVRGNNDYNTSVPDSDLLDFGGHRFFLCHGHRYSLHGDFDTLIAVARNNSADVALYGHVHVPYFENENGVLLINPGSIGRPRSKAGATFALIECLPESPIKAQFWGIDSSLKISLLEICS